MMQRKTYLLTGAAGFIGSNLAHHLASKGDKVVVYDKLTYAGNKASLDGIPTESLAFVNGDICDTALVYETLVKYGVDAVFHLAAESHVDRSIDGQRHSSRPTSTGHFPCSPPRVNITKRWTMRKR